MQRQTNSDCFIFVPFFKKIFMLSRKKYAAPAANNASVIYMAASFKSLISEIFIAKPVAIIVENEIIGAYNLFSFNFDKSFNVHLMAQTAIAAEIYLIPIFISDGKIYPIIVPTRLKSIFLYGTADKKAVPNGA